MRAVTGAVFRWPPVRISPTTTERSLRDVAGVVRWWDGSCWSGGGGCSFKGGWGDWGAGEKQLIGFGLLTMKVENAVGYLL